MSRTNKVTAWIREDLEFLPALLEIQDTPPLPMARWLLRAIVLFFAAAISWTSVGRVDVVATAPGRIIPGGGVKIVQPLETAVIQKILVREGDPVAAGQPLIELDATQPAANLEQLHGEALALKRDRARLETLVERSRDLKAGRLAVSSNPSSRADFHSRLATGATTDLPQMAARRLESEWLEYRAGLQALGDEIQQRRAEHASLRQRILQLEATIPLIAERAQASRLLLDKGLAPRSHWLELEQDRIEQVKERDIQIERLAMLAAAISGLGRQQISRTAGFQQRLLAELEEVGRRLSALEQESLKAAQRVNLHTITAPVAGRVDRVAVHTIGGVVTPAQELMRIVPGADVLQVEAWIRNQDIGHVRVGQSAAIKIEAFPFTKFGTVDGKLLSVSTDAMPDEHLGPVYTARVGLARAAMSLDTGEVPLTPGMAVTVEFKLGSRRIIEFLLSPLLRYKAESIRER